MHIKPSITEQTYCPVYKIAYCFAAKTWLNSHPLIAMTIS